MSLSVICNSFFGFLLRIVPFLDENQLNNDIITEFLMRMRVVQDRVDIYNWDPKAMSMSRCFKAMIKHKSCSDNQRALDISSFLECWDWALFVLGRRIGLNYQVYKNKSVLDNSAQRFYSGPSSSLVFDVLSFVYLCLIAARVASS